MTQKIYTPNDFPKENPSDKRSEIISKIDEVIKSGNYLKTDEKIVLEIKGNYNTDQLIDFQQYYSIQGKWKKVETIRHKIDGNDGVKITMYM